MGESEKERQILITQKQPNKKLLDALTASAGIIILVQISLPSYGFKGESLVIISGVLLYLSLGTTLWKQILSIKVSGKAKKFAIYTLVVASIGAGGELFFSNKELSEMVSELGRQRIRVGITTVVGIANMLSQFIWPSAYKQNISEQINNK